MGDDDGGNEMKQRSQDEEAESHDPISSSKRLFSFYNEHFFVGPPLRLRRLLPDQTGRYFLRRAIYGVRYIAGSLLEQVPVDILRDVVNRTHFFSGHPPALPFHAFPCLDLLS